ncbi:MAG: DNA polymerase IV, partial [Planctomycetota bacterium]
MSKSHEAAARERAERALAGRRDANSPRRILHLDVDAFLASVEQALHPELRGRPVVVGGAPTDRNLVMSCSYEARPFGVKPGLLLPEAKKRCPQAVFRRGDSQAANRLREQIARVAFEYTPRIEITSIDDLFVDLTGAERLNGRAFDVAETIKERVHNEVHLPLTIGVGTNKILARLAGKLAKPGGIAEIWPGAEEAFLRHLPVEHLPGVGHRITPLLERFGVQTVGQLRLASRELLFASFGSNGLQLFDRARGIDTDPVEPSFTMKGDGNLELRPPKSIRRDSTFEPEEGRREHVEAMLGYLVERAA